MHQRCRWGIGWLVVVGLLIALLLTRPDSSTSLAEQPSTDGFTPVAPSAAIHSALQSNLQIVRDWIKEKDFASAAESAQGVIALAQLYSYQSADSAWRTKTATLRETLARLITAANAKDLEGCKKALDTCETILADLAKNPPQGTKTAEKNFKPAGPLKIWMLLMDGTYSDAKTAKNAKEMEHLAYTIAEGVNGVRHFRDEARWREGALAVREQALQSAKKAQAGELEPAREALKEAYQRCEACHKAFKQ